MGGGEKPAPNTEGVEVTPEMIAVGAELVREFDPEFDRAEDYAERVFRRMLEVRAARASSSG
jgi:hypothetical protein